MPEPELTLDETIAQWYIDQGLTPPEVATVDELAVIYSWLPPDALALFIENWPTSGDADVAWAAVRNDQQYEQWFPGNMTEDGRPRYSEDVYAAVTASYDDVFKAAGIEGEALEQMQARYGELISGDVAPTELETNRVKPMYERIIQASDSIKAYYSATYGVGLSITDLLVSAMNPELGKFVLQDQIRFSEIGGEALESGFNLSAERVQSLAEVVGMDRARADQLFSDAEMLTPMLTTLAKRHNDPDDDFNVEDFIQADVFSDPDQMYRMRRLMASERSMFGQSSSLRRTQSGAVTGLVAE